MGLHRYVRVVINGAKIHASGGNCRNYILNDIIYNNLNYCWKRDNQWNNDKHINDSVIFSMRYIFIKKHRNRKNRSVEKIIEFSYLKGHTLNTYMIENPFVSHRTSDGVVMPKIFNSESKEFHEDINKIPIEDILIDKGLKLSTPNCEK